MGLPSPRGEPGGEATLLVGDPYHRLFANLRHRQKFGKLSAVSAATFRLGGPYRTGRAFSPGVSYEEPLAWPKDTTLNIPTFRKLNLYTALNYELSALHSLEVSYLGDYFYDVAYPALIMDARHSAMHLVSLRHRMEGFSDLRLYASTVFHDMTDETRPEGEIRTRIIMPGMYMPMRGRTQSVGGLFTLNMVNTPNFQWLARYEMGLHRAWALMDMLPLGGGSVMTLLNLADIEFWQGSLTTEAAYRYRGWRLEARQALANSATRSRIR